MPTVTFPDCSPGFWGYVRSECQDGLTMATPQPIERRDINTTLIDLTVNINVTGGAVAALGVIGLARWIIKVAAFTKTGPNVYVDSKPVPIKEAELVQALEEKVGGNAKGKA